MQPGLVDERAAHLLLPMWHVVVALLQRGCLWLLWHAVVLRPLAGAATLDAFLGRVGGWGSDVVSAAIPHGDEDEDDDEEDPGSCGSYGGSGRCSGSEVAGGERMEDGRHGGEKGE